MIQRKPPAKRMFTGLVGLLEPDDEPVSVAVEEPPAQPAPIKRRGRPFTDGHRKTAAEIKRNQRRRHKQELDSARLSQEQRRIYDQARQRIEAELNEAVARGDEAKAQEIRDIIRGQEEQREYNAQLARSRKPRGGGGAFIADAPRGLGKIVYGNENIIAVGDRSATLDEDGGAVFEKPSQRVTAYNCDGEIAHSEYAPFEFGKEKEDGFHDKKHPIKWRRDPKRSEFDRRDQEERIFGRAGEYLEFVTVAIIGWDGEAFSVIRNADWELRCKLCGRSHWTWKAARGHLVDDHALRIAPTSTKNSRANQKLLAAALEEQEAEIERGAAANGWRKVGGKWIKAN